MVGKILCYLYLSPERRRTKGFYQQELYDELLTRPMNRAAEAGEQPFHRFGSGPPEAAGKMRASLNRLRRLGMVWFMGHDSSKFRITESVFRFGADVRRRRPARSAAPSDPRREAMARKSPAAQ